MCENITRLKKLSQYNYGIAMDNISNFVKYARDGNLLLVYTLYDTAQKEMSHILEYLKY